MVWLSPDPTSKPLPLEIATLQLIRSGMTMEEICKKLHLHKDQAERMASTALFHFAYYNPEVCDHAISEVIIELAGAVREALEEALQATEDIINPKTGEIIGTRPDHAIRMMAVTGYKELKDTVTKRAGNQLQINLGINQPHGSNRFSFESELRKVKSEAVIDNKDGEVIDADPVESEDKEKDTVQ